MKDKIARAIAWALPRRVAYWASLRVGAYATSGAHSHTSVPDLPFMVAIERWHEKKKVIPHG